MSRKSMPIMGTKMIKEIPWELISPHEKQAQANHRQSLKRLAERGGIDAGEAIDILTGRSVGNTDGGNPKAEKYLIAIVNGWKASKIKPVVTNDLRKQTMALYKPPFSCKGGVLFDASSNLVNHTPALG